MNHFAVDKTLCVDEAYENLWSKVNKIPGYITKNEGLILYTLSMVYSQLGNIVEIGPFHGKSSVILGRGIKDSNNNRNLICVDNFIKQESDMFSSAQNPKSALLKNMNKFKISNIFRLYENDGAEILYQLNKEKHGLIFIDGDHTEYQLSKEFPLATKAIHQKGVILIHDYRNSSVERGYSEWIDKNIRTKYETIYVQDSTPKYEGNGLLIVKPGAI